MLSWLRRLRQRPSPSVSRSDHAFRDAVHALLRGRCHLKHHSSADPKIGVFLLGERKSQLLQNPVAFILRNAAWSSPEEDPIVARLYVHENGSIQLETSEELAHPLIQRAVTLLRHRGIHVQPVVRVPIDPAWGC